MKPLWFAYCTCEDYPVVQHEIELRECDACILRVEDLQLLERVARSLEESAAGTMVLARGLGIEAHAELIERISKLRSAGRVVVLVEEVDPSRIAPLFYAGADEVAPLEKPSRGKEGNEDEPPFEWDARVPANPKAQAAQKVARGSNERAEERAAVPYDDDLDEPDSAADQTMAEQARRRSEPKGRQAPIVCVASGRGGCGKTTIATSLALCAAHMGLRAALVDLDLMFGNAHAFLGVETPRDLESLAEAASRGSLSEDAIVKASMRVMPGFTVWGPIAIPERAELAGKPAEMLLEVLRAESDIVIVDTSATWTDAVAAAVASCDRFLVVCDGTAGCGDAAQRLIALAGRFGVPRTRMTCVVNRVGPRACSEDVALRIEMKASLSSKVRIADGGTGLASLAAVGRMDEMLRGQTAFAQSIKRFARTMLRELGCPVPEEALEQESRQVGEKRSRLRLPWKNAGEAA